MNHSPKKKSVQKGQQLKPAAFLDPAFMIRDEMRANRLALEFERAELELRDHGIKSTVVVFGSSRAIAPKAPTRSSKRTKKPKVTPGMRKLNGLEDWYQVARDFAKLVSEQGGAMSPRDGVYENVVTTGGGPGIMEAANRGAADAGAPTIGFNIMLPNEQQANAYITPSLIFWFHYFAVRKMHFAMRANALAVFPGGFGTLDELFEILTLKQTRKTSGMPVILFCREYWNSIVDFNALADMGVIDQRDLELMQMVDSADEGWQVMLDHGLKISTPLHEA
jgi:uncharacterized protein (TIGR00730 family)